MSIIGKAVGKLFSKGAKQSSKTADAPKAPSKTAKMTKDERDGVAKKLESHKQKKADVDKQKKAEADKRYKAEMDRQYNLRRAREAERLKREDELGERIRIDRSDEYNKQLLAKGGMVKKPATKSKGKK